MIRPSKNRFARHNAAAQKPLRLEMTLHGFSATQHYGDRSIFRRKRAYHFRRGRPCHFGQIGFWRPHHFQAQTAVSFRAKTAVTSPPKNWKTEAVWTRSKSENSFLFHKTRKNEKKRRCIHHFYRFLVPLSISRSWLSGTRSDYLPPNEPSVASVP